MRLRYFLFLLLVFSFSVPTIAQGPLLDWTLREMQRQDAKAKWIDSVFSALSLDERIAQFYMVAAYSNKDSNHVKEIAKLVKDYKVGGLIFMQGNPGKQAELTNYYQSLAKVKLLISIDGEWGLQMRLKDSTIAFPRQLTLGAVKDDSLIYSMGREIAQECKRLGIHINFAPDVDVNNNPNNPVIGDRSFGEDRLRVATKGLQYALGMQHGGVMACAKHFPGHGDTDSDSHLTLPLIAHDRKRLDSIELYPFRYLIDHGVQSVMAAHLNVPALDKTKDQPTSVSRKVVTDLLKKELGFDGLVFSDALNMKGASNYDEPGELSVRAFIAGNDILLFADDVPKGIELFKKAIKKGDIDLKEMEIRLKKVLAAKYDAGLYDFQPIVLQNLNQDLNNSNAKAIRRQLYQQALTLVSNKGNLLPIKTLDTLSIASLAIGLDSIDEMQQMMDWYTTADHFSIKKSADSLAFIKLLRKLSSYDLVVIGLHDMVKASSKNYGLSPQSLDFIKKLQARTKVAVVAFGSPYSLSRLGDVNCLLLAYEDNKDTREVATEAIFGAIPISGTLPVTASPQFPAGKGIQLPSLSRLRYGYPEQEGISAADLNAIDSIAWQAIRDSATPGCQVLVAKNGNVIYHKAFGYHTYEATQPVLLTDLYDLASITKIAGTTPAVMQLYDKGLFDLNKTLGDYIPGISDTLAIRNIKMADILTHQAGLRPFIPFYKKTLADSMYAVCYRNAADSAYCIEVRKDLFMVDYHDTIFQGIFQDRLDTSKGYVYSDLGFYLLKEIVASLARDGFDHYLDTALYRSLGMQTMGFNPSARFDLQRIPPTENDTEFRKALVHGYVHDQGAAMLGGVSGHAGLFSNANDLAILMQMLLNHGQYGGKRFIDSSTINFFTAKYSDKSRRGLGFDKPETDPKKASPTSDLASSMAYGHQGFTGTVVWVDPKYDLVYIFLSNRIYPNVDNKKLNNLGVRSKIHEAIYQAIEKSASLAMDEN
ncbi:MAG: glycoside hydrolase family 3 N-terminal domain-containing protein [Chitinophagales bacterium]|nr:glycoside hydrolase family 3 N-terminal domain-containing protein [Chitinophagales bacterium]